MPSTLRVTHFSPFVPGSLPVLPAYEPPVRAGFPSPAEDYAERRIDLNRQLVKHPAATFLVRVVGDSMTGVGIHSGDVLVVDRSEEAREGNVVVAVMNGELVVKRYARSGGRPLLVAENPAYAPVPVGDLDDFKVWGVVKHVIHTL